MDPVGFFAEGGAGMYLALLLWLLAMGAGVAHALLGRTVTGGASAVLLALLLVTSFGSFMKGRALVDEAVVNVNPVDREAIRTVGYREASRNLQLGIPLLLLGLIPLGIGESRRQKASAATPPPA